MKNLILFIFFNFFFINLHALELKGKFYQGNLIIGNTEPGSQIYVDKKKIKI